MSSVSLVQQYRHSRLYVWYAKFKTKRFLRNGVDYSKQQLFNAQNRNVLFIHIPKTAGVAIHESIYSGISDHHACALDFYREDPQQFRKAFSFAVVRHPVERLLSAYTYLKTGGKSFWDVMWKEMYIDRYQNFNDFVLNGGLKTALNRKAEHFIPQTEFVTINDEIVVDLLVPFEQLDTLQPVLSEKLQRNVEFAKRNQTKMSKKSVSVSPQAKAVIEEIYSDDIALFEQVSQQHNQ